jgi:DNA/RNA-binding domain of Phe-tRNA-synthetase-like protein
LGAAIADAVSAMLGRPEPADAIAATRAMYKALGIDPTKTRPSSEALLRRVRRGDAFPRINTLVDLVNWTSLETQLSFGLYDAAAVRGDVTLRRGREGEGYAGIRKDTVHVAGRFVLVDAEGPFGNPTSDSARTMVTVATTAAAVVIYAPAAWPASAVDRAAALTAERIARFAAPADRA